MNKKLAKLLPLLIWLSIPAFGQGKLHPNDVNHVDSDGVPIVNSVTDKIDRPSEEDQNRCIKSEHDLTQYVEELNAKLFHMETQRQAEFFVRHGDRMAIVSLIQREMIPFSDKIHRAIFHKTGVGSGEYCDLVLKEGIDLAKRIYDANLKHRMVNK
nr:hypothetical protein [uncultured Duganella sp.]